MRKKCHFIILLLLTGGCMMPGGLLAQRHQTRGGKPLSDHGATELTPSRSEYFSWISHTNEGPTEAQTLANLNYFKWLRDTYGMQLDFYAFDAGVIDGAHVYGNQQTEHFRKLFPEGFGRVTRLTRSMGTKLGLWVGPDGFGNTQEEAEDRIRMMVELVRNDNFGLFKFDKVCGDLRPSKYGYFERMMTEIRKADPDFVVLNHRLDLGPGNRFSTTYLLGGDETYIDAHMTNTTTGTHHRVAALSRHNPPTRLTEDHGVCLSSCLDYWDDDLVLQAFCRNLILAPEIYGNPWLLRDDEQAQMAFLFDLHRQYRDILKEGMTLPESHYGPDAVSRGNGNTRWLVLRNLSWNPVKYTVRLNGEIGLIKKGKVTVRQYHPYIQYLGRYAYGDTMQVEVLPFRACLVKVTAEAEKDPVVDNDHPYRIIKGGQGRKDRIVRLNIPKSTSDWHRRIAVMDTCAIPADIRALYDATLFAADNNPFEVRSLHRSGPTQIPEVQKARDAFFQSPTFVQRELWDKNLFDNDPASCFSLAWRGGDPRPHGISAFTLDLGEEEALDSLVITTPDEYSLQPLKIEEGTVAQVSADLKSWRQVVFVARPHAVISFAHMGPVRYLEFLPCPIRLAEVTGYKNGKVIDRSLWRASNLFLPYGTEYTKAAQTWKSSFTLSHIYKGAYLCIAVNGKHGCEGAWAACKIDGKLVGCPDRAPSYPANTWERRVQERDANYTYYLPLTPEMAGKQIEVVVMAFNKKETDLKPEVWLTANF